MKKYKDKTCLKCDKKYTPTSSKQKFCHNCGITNRKEINKKYKQRPDVKIKIKETKKKYYQRPEIREKQIFNSKEFYKKNKERIKRNMRINGKKKYKMLKEEFFKIYGKTCSCCGEDNILFLTLDHINGDGGKERKIYDTRAIYKNAVKEKDRTKYQTLCFNCNQGKYINGGICPHKKLLK